MKWTAAAVVFALSLGAVYVGLGAEAAGNSAMEQIYGGMYVCTGLLLFALCMVILALARD